MIGNRNRTRRSETRRLPQLGFSLVELLVVIAIIAMLVALLLPAVQQAREAGRRINCTNSCRQLGLALVNYESVNGKFPPPGYAGINKTPKLEFGDFVPHHGRQLSWIVFTLPFMEEQALYDQFDLEKSVFKQVGNPGGVQPPMLLCPSDGAEGRIVQAPYTEDVPLAKANYAAWASPFHIDLQSVWPGAMGSWGLKLKEVEDGMSKTFMISEVRTRAETHDQRGAWAVPWNGASLLAFDAHHDFDQGGMRFFADVESAVFMQTPNHQGPNLDPIYGCRDPEDAQVQGMPCATWEIGVESVSYLSSAPRSSHQGGVNVAMMDGSAKFVPDEIDPIAMAYQISVSDGQTANETE